MKKVLTKFLILAFAVTLLSAGVCHAQSNILDSTELNVIKILEIANGDENGNMNFDKSVTRAEFVKMAISTSPFKSSAIDTKLNVTLFTDVKNTYWGAPYISAAVNNGLINGYLDGTFRPNNQVNLEEAATITLRLLGYNNLQGTYPSAQLAKYEELDLNEDITASKGDKLSREQCMQLLYNALSAKTAGGSVYCNTLGLNANSEGKLDYGWLLENKLDGPVILEENSKLEKAVGFTLDANTSYQLNNSPCEKSEIKTGDAVYYSKEANAVFAYRKTATGIVTSVSDSAVSLTSKTYSLSTAKAKNKLSLGGEFNGEKAFVTLILGINDTVVDVVTGNTALLDDNTDNATYTSLIDATISTPIYIENKSTLSDWQSKIPFDVKQAFVLLNGKKSDLSNIKVLDVVYYSKPFNSIWVYRSTKSGVITNISANTVVIGNSAYTVVTNGAKYKISTYGEYSKDDYVTLILGKNDEVIDIVDADRANIGLSEDDASYSEVVASSLKGPYVVAKDKSMANLKIDADNAVIYYLGNKVSKDIIKPYDVYYFSDIVNTIWIYRDTVSGVIESISPVSAPTTVVLSGKNYMIKDSKVSYALSNFGSFGVGDKVTFLLGMDGDVAGVVSTSEVSTVIYGVVTAKGEKTFSDKYGSEYTADFITVTDTACNSTTYELNNNSRVAVGDVVRVYVTDTVKITELSTEVSNSDASLLVNAMNEGKFSDDCEIVDIYEGKAIKVYPSRLAGLNIDKSFMTYNNVILYYEFNDNGEISKLILDNFTGDGIEYGVVTYSEDGLTKYMTDLSTKTVYLDGTENDVGGCAIYTNGGLVTRINNLFGTVKNIDYITKENVVDKKGKEYALSQNVKAFVKSADTYTYTKLDDIISGNYNYTAYYDKLPDAGGRIRVIVAVRAV